MTSHPPAAVPAALPSTPGAEAKGRNGWSEAAVEGLKALWADPGLSASVIARRLGVSRNAVLGKVHRLGLSNRRSVPTTPSPRAPRTPRPPRAPRPPAARTAPRPVSRRMSTPEPAIDPGPGLARRLEDIPRQGCHWPVGDPLSPGFAFCGRPARQAPYCDAHRAIAYRPGGSRDAGRLLRTARG